MQSYLLDLEGTAMKAILKGRFSEVLRFYHRGRKRYTYEEVASKRSLGINRSKDPRKV